MSFWSEPPAATLVCGLGSVERETLMDAGRGGMISARLGFPDAFSEDPGSQAEIMAKYGLTGANLAAKTKPFLSK